MNLIYYYEKLMYYSSVSLGEYSKFGTLINLGLLIIAALGVRGIKPTKWVMGIFFIIVFVLCIVGGVLLVKLGVPQINNSLSNQQNLQVQQILSNQQIILEKLK